MNSRKGYASGFTIDLILDRNGQQMDISPSSVLSPIVHEKGAQMKPSKSATKAAFGGGKSQPLGLSFGLGWAFDSLGQ